MYSHRNFKTISLGVSAILFAVILFVFGFGLVLNKNSNTKFVEATGTQIALPTLNKTYFDAGYSGGPTATYDKANVEIVAADSTETANASGTYKIVFKLKDPVNTEWVTGHNRNIALAWRIGGSRNGYGAPADVWDGVTSTAPVLLDSSEENSEENPYLIASAANLRYLATNGGSFVHGDYDPVYFKQTVNIDLGGHLWTPIMDLDAFNYDGDEHVILNLNINVTSDNYHNYYGDSQYVGLFGYVSGSSDITIQNLGIESGLIQVSKNSSGSSCVGSFIGFCGYHTYFQNCYSKANITCTSTNEDDSMSIGGFVGYVSACFDADNCYNVGNISYVGKVSASVGGLCSDANSADFHNVYNSGNLSAECTSTGASKSVYVAGILVNQHNESDLGLYHSYNTGSITAINSGSSAESNYVVASGLVCYCWVLSISDCYNAGQLTATRCGATTGTNIEKVGLVRYSDFCSPEEVPNDCFYDAWASGAEYAFTDEYNFYEEPYTENLGLSTTQMQSASDGQAPSGMSTFTEGNGWVFVQGKYPTLTSSPDYYSGINTANLTIPTLTNNTYSYSSTLENELEFEDFNSSFMQVDAIVDQSAGNNRVVTVSLKDPLYSWSDGTNAAKSYYITINKAIVALPTLDATYFESTGNTITPGVDVDTTRVTVSGQTSASAAGDYQIVFTLNSAANMQWANGHSRQIAIAWRIDNGSYGDVGYNLPKSVWDGSASAAPVLLTAGSNSEANPYLIKSAANLRYVALNPATYNGAYFKQMVDIDLNNQAWTPINTGDNNYAYYYNGNGHTISNINVSSNSQYVGGLFGYVSDGSYISNLGIESGTIESTYSSSTDAYLGGFVGYMGGSFIFENCYNKASVSSTASYNSSSYCKYVGGLAGYAYNTTITNCYNTGSINYNGDNSVELGGFVGYVGGKGTFANVYNTGSVSGTCTYSSTTIYVYVGGIVGYASGRINITNGYNIGSVLGHISSTANDYRRYIYVGGLVGTTFDYLTLTRCYNIGEITAKRGSDIYQSGTYLFAGGLAGGAAETITDSYFNIETSNTNYAYRTQQSYGLTTEQMQVETNGVAPTEMSAFTEANGWTLVAGQYPTLNIALPMTTVSTANLVIPTLNTTTYEYDANLSDKLDFNDFYSDFMTVTIVDFGLGTKTVRVTLNDAKYSWANGSDAAQEYSITVVKKKVALPTLDATYFDVGGTITPDIDYDSTNARIVTSSSTLSASAAGQYNIVFELLDTAHAEWANGHSRQIAIAWRIDGSEDGYYKAVATSTWDGTTATIPVLLDTSAENSESNPYLIASAANLAYLSAHFADFNGAYFKQTVNIDLNNHLWTPINTSFDTMFKVIYDGDGHTISNLHIEAVASFYEYCVGLFGKVSDDSSISNLGIESGSVQLTTTYDFSYCGSLVGYGGNISYCYNKASLTFINQTYTDGMEYFGGLAAYANTITYSYNTGTLHYEEQENNCANIGGVAARVNAGASFCYNTGDITGLVSWGYVSGIVEDVYNGYLIDCYNQGDISLSIVYEITIFGIGSASSIERCYSSGSVVVTNNNSISFNVSGDDCYFNTDGISQEVASYSYDYETDAANYGLTTAQMLVTTDGIAPSAMSAFTEENGWTLVAGQYPTLNLPSFMVEKNTTASIAIPTLNTTTYEYDANLSDNLDFNNFYSDFMTVTIVDFGLGTKTVRVTLNDAKYSWANGSDAAQEYSITVVKKKVALPTLDATYFDEGGTITPDIDYDSTNARIVTSSSTLSASAAGQYNIVFELLDTAHAEWANGHQRQIALAWRIGGSSTGYVNAPAVSVWDGSSTEAPVLLDTSGSNSESNPYLIASAANLAYLSAHYADFDGAYFKQTVNIDLNNHLWTPIYTLRESVYYDGNDIYTYYYDGGNHYISNLYIEMTNATCVGLFGYISDDSTISNLGIESGSVQLTTDEDCCFCGSIVGYGGNISHCYNKASVTFINQSCYDGYEYAGGLAGCASIITYSYNTGHIFYDEHEFNCPRIGGVAGVVDTEISHCYNTGSVEVNGGGSACVSGITTGVSTRMADCYNTGDLFLSSEWGIALFGYGSSCERCYNSGNIVVTDAVNFVFENASDCYFNVGGVSSEAAGYLSDYASKAASYGLTTAQMQVATDGQAPTSMSAFTTANGWTLVAGQYPTLNLPSYGQPTPINTANLAIPTLTTHTFEYGVAAGDIEINDLNTEFMTATVSGTSVGAQTVTITLNDPLYSWSDGTDTAKVLNFTINPIVIAQTDVTISATEYNYDNTAHQPTITVEGLTENTDYTVAYKRAGETTIDFTTAGTIDIIITITNENYVLAAGFTQPSYTINQTYTVTFVVSTDGYGTVNLAQIVYIPNATEITVNENAVTINGQTVTATATAADAQYTYAFTGWTGTAATVTEDMTITANFSRTVNSYAITFNNYDNSLLQERTLEYGAEIAYTGETVPTKPADAHYTYTFNGWSPAITGTVTGDATYTATYNSTVNSYTITFNSNGGSAVDSQTLDYGEHVEQPTAPEKANYRFDAWYLDNGLTEAINFTTYTVSGTATLYARWIRVLTNDDVTLSATAYDYNNTVHKPTITVAELTENTDYTVTYKRAGEAMEDFTTVGTIDITITITNEDYELAEGFTQPSYVINQTYMVSFIVNTEGYGAVDLAQIVYIPNGTAISVSNNTVTINGQIVTATATANTAEYTYAFVNWTGTAATVTEDMTITANFTRTLNSYTITFNNYDNSLLQERTLEYGAEIAYTGETVPTKPADAHYTYTFNGWSPAITGTVTGDATYTATYSETVNSYTITFNSNGGSAVDSQTLDYGEHVEQPTAPEKANYRFDGWFLDEQLTQAMNFGTYTVVGTQTLYAKWVRVIATAEVVLSATEYVYNNTEHKPDVTILDLTENTDYTVVFKKNGETAEDFTSAGTIDLVVTILNEDYELAQDFVQPSYVINPIVIAQTDVTLSATEYNYDNTAHQPTITVEGLTENEDYTIAYKRAGETTIDFTSAGTIDIIITITNENYALAAGFTQPSYTINQTYTVTFVVSTDGYGTVNLAQIVYIPNATEITVNENAVTINGQTVTATATAADAQYTYAFTGWTGTAATVTEDMTITANFSRTVNSYAITFNNYNGAELQVRQLDYGDAITYTGETPTKAADNTYTYAFSGWDPDITSLTVTGAATFVAQFTSNYIDYTVIFNNYDGTMISSDTYHYGAEVVVPANPTRASTVQYTYTFNGWNPAVAAVTGNATYTATYSETVNSYTITFNSNGGTEVGSQTLEYGANVVEPTAPTKQNYRFDGWFLDEQLTQAMNFGTYTVVGTQTMYAKWTENFHVIYKTAEGEGTKLYGITAETTVEALRGLISEVVEIELSKLTLVFNTTILVDNKTLSECSIATGATIVYARKGGVVKEDVEDNFNNAAIANTTEELASKIDLTEEEQEQVDLGSNIVVTVEVEQSDAGLSEEEKASVVSKLSETQHMSNCMSVNFYKQVGTLAKTLIDSIESGVLVEIKIPEELKALPENVVSRAYKVARINGSEVTILDAQVKGDAIKFMADSSSKYMIICDDTPKANGSPLIWIILGIAALAAVATVAAVFAMRKGRVKGLSNGKSTTIPNPSNYQDIGKTTTVSQAASVEATKPASKTGKKASVEKKTTAKKASSGSAKKAASTRTATSKATTTKTTTAKKTTGTKKKSS